MREERRAIVGLWCTLGIGAWGIARIRKVFGDLSAIADQPVRRWISSVPVSQAARDGLLALPTTLGAHADAVLERAHALEMKIAFIDDPVYPRGLGKLRSAPPLLFFQGRGDRPNGPRRVAMVGSRHFESAFAPAALALARGVAERLIVVSGAAMGIDQLCHRGALAAKGETWAFLGCALDQIDTAQLAVVGEILSAQGTVFTEFPPGVRGDRTTFPRRNRLISGASDAVILVRGHGESGALITVDYAVAQRRPVLAVPGQIDHLTARAPNALIRAGKATMVDSPQAVFEAMGLTDSRSEPAAINALAVDVTTLSPNAQRAFEALDRNIPADFDVLLGRAGPLNSGQLASALVELELSGLLVQRPGRRYERR